MPTGTISISASIGGMSFINSVTKTAEHPNPYEVELPPGTLEASYVQTDADTCEVTLTAGHGLTSGVYDAYWTESGVDKIAVGCTGTIHDTNELTLDVPISGDNFPAADPTDMVVCKQVVINTTIDGDTVEMVAICAVFTATETEDCSVDFHDVGSNQITTLRLVSDEPWTWWNDSGITNPMTGAPITHCHASNQSVTNTAVLKIATLEDPTPA